MTWPKPGPGTWELDLGHFHGGCARICHEVISRGMTDGLRESFEIIGSPLKTVEAAFVNGWFYLRRVPLVGGGVDLPPPPAPLLWLVTRVHPAFRKAEKRAVSSFASKVWYDELDRWNDEWKPQLLAESERLTAIDPGALGDAELADHIDDVARHLQSGATLHFRLHTSDLGPIGLLLVRGGELGLDRAELMRSLSGYSPATNAPGIALRELRRLVAAEGASPGSIEELRAISPAVEHLLDEFLDTYGWRLTTGYDLRDRTLRELPAAVIAAVTATDDGDPAAVQERAVAVGEEALASLLAQVRPENRAELTELVTDARAMYGLRDENGPITYQWPAGVMRRAILEVARRLSARGQLPDIGTGPGEVNDAVFDLLVPEMGSLLRGAGGPGPEEVRARYDERLAWSQLDPPARLGPEEAIPPSWTLPTQLGKSTELILTVMDLLESDTGATAGAAGTSTSDRGAEAGRGASGNVIELTGEGVGQQEPYVGRACVVISADDALSRIEVGDVLVAPFTVPTFNSVLAISGAVVVDNGGLLSHAAVIAREYGIPGVVGVGSGTTSIPDGAEVRVDPVAGTVTVV